MVAVSGAAMAGAAVAEGSAPVSSHWHPARLDGPSLAPRAVEPVGLGAATLARRTGVPGRPIASRSCVRVPASTYRRRRAVAAGLVVVLVLVACAALGMLGGGPLAASERATSSGGRPIAGDAYVVQPGDTLWSIARRIRPGADPRPLVDRLATLHGGTTLYVGERIMLPAP